MKTTLINKTRLTTLVSEFNDMNEYTDLLAKVMPGNNATPERLAVVQAAIERGKKLVDAEIAKKSFNL